MSEIKNLTRSAGLVGFQTLLSRILGLVRDITITYLFGAGVVTDAFWVAFRIPNLLRRLLAEGALTVSFIPVFTDKLENQGPEKAKEISDSVFTLLSIILIVICILGIIYSPYLVKLFASGFDESSFNLTVLLNRFMFPFIFFVSLSALCMGVLNSLKHFFAPSFSPVLFNVCIIVVAFALHTKFDISIISLALGVVLGGILQFLFHIPYIKSYQFMFRPRLRNLYSPEVRRILYLMVPQLFGLAVYNFNIIVNTQYASHLPGGTVSYLFLSERLVEFPLGLIAVSLGTVLLPNLSSFMSRGETDKFADTYLSTLKLLLYILVPCMFGLIFLSKPICNILYQRGEFGAQQMIYTSQTLVGYALGLWAVGAIRITVPVFYARKDTRTPVKAAFIAFLVNALAGYILSFVFHLNHTGLALASSISSVVYLATLLLLINKKIVGLNFIDLIKYFFKVISIGFVMGISIYKLSLLSLWNTGQISVYKLAVLLACVITGVLIYYLLSQLFRIEQSNQLINMIRNKEG